MYEDDPSIDLALITPASISSLFAPRVTDSNKGRYGHVLMIAGARGKTGAAVMSGLSALRAGAGLVTVACPEESIDAVAAHAPEVMTEALRDPSAQAEKRSVVAIGPGLDTDEATRSMVRQLFADLPKPMVVDADALNCLAGSDWKGCGPLRVLTPHPGEMSRLTGLSIAQVQADRVGVARGLATERGVVMVLKGRWDVDCVPRWAGLDRSDRFAGHGYGGHRGYFNGNGCGFIGAVSGRHRPRDCGSGLSAWAGG